LILFLPFPAKQNKKKSNKTTLHAKSKHEEDNNFFKKNPLLHSSILTKVISSKI